MHTIDTDWQAAITRRIDGLGTGTLVPCGHMHMVDRMTFCASHPELGALCDKCTKAHDAVCDQSCVRCGGATQGRYWDPPATLAVPTVFGFERGADQIRYTATVQWLPMCDHCIADGHAFDERRQDLMGLFSMMLLADPAEATSPEFPQGVHICGQDPGCGAHASAEVLPIHCGTGHEVATLSCCTLCRRPSSTAQHARDGFLYFLERYPLRLDYTSGTSEQITITYRGSVNVHNLAVLCRDCAWWWIEADMPSIDVRQDPEMLRAL